MNKRIEDDSDLDEFILIRALIRFSLSLSRVSEMTHSNHPFHANMFTIVSLFPII